MADHIEQVIEQVVRYREATEELIRALERQTHSSTEDIELLRSGITMADKMRHSRSSTLSRDLTDRLEEFEAVRRSIRLAVTRALVEEGLTNLEIAELFGVSRQLAGRFVHDALR